MPTTCHTHEAYGAAQAADGVERFADLAQGIQLSFSEPKLAGGTGTAWGGKTRMQWSVRKNLPSGINAGPKPTTAPLPK